MKTPSWSAARWRCTTPVIAAMLALAALRGTAAGGLTDTLRVQVPWDDPGVDLRNGQISPFWQELSARGADSLTLQAPSSCHPEWCTTNGPDDCRVTVRAAAFWRGLYVLAVVRDDSWAETPPQWGPFADVVSFWLDLRPPAAIAGCDSCLLRDTGSGLTSTSVQLDVALGLPISGDQPLRWSWYDSVAMTWSSVRLHSVNLEIALFPVDVVWIDEHTRAVEILLPWCVLAVPHLTHIDTLALSFTAGYADRDSGVSDTLVLRWDGIDPLAPRDGVNAWGVMVFGPTGYAENPYPGGHCTLETSAVTRPHSTGRSAAPRGPAAQAGYFYDLCGRRLGTDGASNRGVLLVPARMGILVPCRR